jgi:hypothetical protein
MKGVVFLVERVFNPEVELNLDSKNGLSYFKTKDSKKTKFSNTRPYYELI